MSRIKVQKPKVSQWKSKTQSFAIKVQNPKDEKTESNVRRDYGSCGDDDKIQPQVLQPTTLESLEVKVKVKVKPP